VLISPNRIRKEPVLEDLPKESCEALSSVEMGLRAAQAAAFLKALSHEGRLMILCHLTGGEKTVTEIEDLLSLRQAAVSQQLARLRLEGLVATRREGKAIFYRIGDERVVALLQDLPAIFGLRD